MVSDSENIPQRIDRFHIKRVLNESSVSSIYLAEDRNLRRDVVLKVLRPRLTDDPNWEERFRREAQLTARLNHENIIRVIDIERRDGYLYIILDYVPRSLADLLQQSGNKLTAPDSVRLAQQIASALAYTHSQDVIHRDLTAANILITSDDMVKLVDFGVAWDQRNTGSTLSEPVERDSYSLVGTPQYMSPEQATGGKVDVRSDLFALGVLLCQMLTGHTPLDQLADTQAVIKFHRERNRMPYADLMRTYQVPEGLRRIIGQALEIQPELRYQSASEFEDALRDFASNPAPTPRKARWAIPWAGFVSDRKIQAVGALVLVSAFFVLWASWSTLLDSEACRGIGIAGFNIDGNTYDPETRVLLSAPDAGSEDVKVRIGVVVHVTPVNCKGDLRLSLSPHIDGRSPETSVEIGGGEVVVLSIPAGATEVVVLTRASISTDRPETSLKVDSHITLQVSPSDLVRTP